MFLGEYEYRVDAKGRLPLPTRFREKLKTGLVLTASPEKCIAAYPPTEWEKVAGELTGGAVLASKLRRLSRALFSSAIDLELDAQGRIALPQFLREYASIGSEAVVVGVNNYFEIWGKQGWRAEKEASTGQVWQIIESIERH
jgi:MraZ protein